MVESLTPYSDEDAAWLEKHQHSKLLDARIRILGVAARDAESRPSVLACYPLRVTALERHTEHSAEGTSGERRERRGGSCRKWQAEEPVPWPNFYWLVDPVLSTRVGRLEHLGRVQEWQRDVRHDEAFAAALSTLLLCLLSLSKRSARPYTTNR